MNHDPLCRRAKIMESLMEGCPECDLIARVREDERMIRQEEKRVSFMEGQETCALSYRKALRDAIDAARTTKYHGDKPLCRCGGCHANNTAVAAIEALGEDR